MSCKINLGLIIAATGCQ